MLRAHCFHPIVLCCFAAACAHAEEGKDILLAKHEKKESKKSHLREPHAKLRPFIFRMGTPPVREYSGPPPRSPERFNPDPPRTSGDRSPNDPRHVQALPPAQQGPPALSDRLVPNYSVLFPDQPVQATTAPALPPGQQLKTAGEGVRMELALPRRNVRGREVIDERWHYPEYPLGREGLGLFPNTVAHPNRWFLDFPHWQRYHDPYIEQPYQYNTPRLWHPYEQSILKGDVPIIGQEIFLNLIAKNFTLAEYRRLPVPSGVSAAQPNSSEFFGRSEQFFINNDTSFTAELFKGETAFKPVNWSIRFTGVYNRNYLWVKENNLVDPDPRGSDFVEGDHRPDSKDIQAIPTDQNSVNPKTGIPGPFVDRVDPGDAFNYLAPELKPLGNAKGLVGVDPNTNRPGPDEKDQQAKKKDNDFKGSRYTRRFKDFFAVQELFAEIHFSDLSNNYDFISSRSGIQPFNSDFRGFIFSDTNLGFRLFGNLDNNRIQYNAVIFDMLEKDTYSDLNTLDSRRQKVLILNVYRQDFLWKGYTAQFSFHGNWDNGEVHYDKNGFITRPEPLGTVRTIDDSALDHLRDKNVQAYYLGWTGDGHIDRLNITHAFYQVFGQDSFNGLAGRRVDINAQMAALELSYDRDYIRFKLSGFYASGDSNPTDQTARGFDTILDHPFFIGGPFSWYTHQGFNLAGTSVNLKQRDSLVMDMRTSKTEGQSNFVNPGVFLLGLGTDIDVTPKLKAFANANYIWLAQTKPIEQALMTNKIKNELGLDLSLGFKYRPLLTDNIIISAGLGLFLPGAGYESIYRRNTNHVPGLGVQQEEGKVDKYLYNAFLTVTLTY